MVRSVYLTCSFLVLSAITIGQNRTAGRSRVPVQTDVHDIDFICYKGLNERPASREHADTTFGNERMLDVTVSDPSHLLNQESLREILSDSAFALTIWRRMCTRCASANAAVIRLNGTVYVDEYLAGVLTSIDYDHIILHGPPPSDLGCPTCPLARPSGPSWTSMDVVGAILSSRLTVRVPLFTYVAMQNSSPAAKRLCSAPAGKVPSLLRGARVAFRCATDKTVVPSALNLRLVDGYTRCGPQKNIVGCEPNDFTIELNAHEYKFVRHITGVQVFGNGDSMVDLQAVLLHEMGHWTGINGHLTSTNNIMSAYATDAHCIDESVVQALANATVQPVFNQQPLPLYYRREH